MVLPRMTVQLPGDGGSKEKLTIRPCCDPREWFALHSHAQQTQKVRSTYRSLCEGMGVPLPSVQTRRSGRRQLDQSVPCLLCKETTLLG